MRVLAIDTALEACSVAILDTDLSDVRVHESVPMQRGHAEALMPLIARVLDRAQLAFAALDRVAVTTGPG
ncbi:MAG: tRNA (adenosine(37)-N6)-threonylcarbamoyltransferase complex dimerization subunit type 1 TsaB, partial [Pseudolabrys sp.]